MGMTSTFHYLSSVTHQFKQNKQAKSISAFSKQNIEIQRKCSLFQIHIFPSFIDAYYFRIDNITNLREQKTNFDQHKKKLIKNIYEKKTGQQKQKCDNNLKR